MNQIHCILLSLTLVTGCARTKTPPQAPDHLQIKNYPEALKKLESLPIKEACDEKIFKVRHDLVEEITLLREKIANHPHPKGHTGNRVKINPEIIPFQGSYLVGASEGAQESPGEWKHFESGWVSAREKFDKNRNLSDEDRFSMINHAVQSLIMNDTFRSFHEINLGINYDTVGSLSEINQTVQACVKDSSCLLPRFTEFQQKVTAKIPMYSKLLKELELASNEKEKREVILSLENRLRQDVHRYLYRGNAPVTRLTADQKADQKADPKTVLKLALNPGSLKEDESTLLEKSIEELWKNTTTSIQVAWNTGEAGTNLFKVMFHLNEPGKRANTDPGNHTVNLYPGTRVRSIGHEIGHVLGFPDHYYTVWDGEKCTYSQYSISTDLMSDSQNGVVTDEEWAELVNEVQSPRS